MSIALYEDSKIVIFGQKRFGIDTFWELIGQNEILPLFEVTGRRKLGCIVRTRKS